MPVSALRLFRTLGIACLLALVFGLIWHELNGSPSTTMAGGARHLTMSVPATKSDASLEIICFSQEKFRMKVVDNPHPEDHLYLADKARWHGAVAGCNGGYFHTKDFTPSGLQRADGVSTGAFETVGPGAAVFGVRNGVPFIAAEKGFQPAPDVSDMVQCSPLLVENGVVQPGLGSATNTRTFVMTDGKGQWAIGAADHLSLDELAALLAKPGLVKDFHVLHAMNLDGGPSTGLWWQDDHRQPHGRRERWSVRNMVLVVPK